ncbi:MAG: hypothetical protein R2764_01490 [Bacteroidales bacterium]
MISKIDAIEAQAQNEKARADRIERENSDLKAKLQLKEDAEKAAKVAQINTILDEAVKSANFRNPKKPILRLY